MSTVSYGLSRHVQELSETVFGQRHRLALMAAIAQSEDGIVNPTELADVLGFRAQSSIQMPLKRLVDAGLLTRIPGLEGRVYYRRQDSHAWAFALELVSRALKSEDAATQ
ncbi:MarR family transcriptional regulator [Mycobacterium sp.]|uniref:MarR family transcriptional regulator n=1 Tax=Mycobacterium sp. TaxID=1785 RepID=UPI0031E18845